MAEVLTAAQMRAIEAAAIASGEVTGLEMMERAGHGVVHAVFAEWPELAAGSHRAVVLCGPGGNGGDGFVVARLLKVRGWEVEVYLYGDPDRMPPDARVNYERWVEGDRVLVVPSSPEKWVPPVFMPHIMIDALFGLGLTRPIDPMLQLFWHEFYDGAATFMNDEHSFAVRCVAVDVPSGLCADSGKSIGFCLEPHLTVTFGYLKHGHVLSEGADHCTRVVVCDIGLPSRIAFTVLGRPYQRETRQKADNSAIVSLQEGHYLRRSDQGTPSSLDKGWYGKERHKYDHGHALILSGTPGNGGAARLAARGALRIGAGVVTMGAPADAICEHAAHLNAIMLRRMGDAAALAEALLDTRISALCLGPGMGTGPREAALLAMALGGPPPPSPPYEGEGRHPEHGAGPVGETLPLTRVRSQGRGSALRPTVLDADALTLLSRNPALVALLHDRCVLTPHAGEFARLFPDIAAKLAEPATRGPAYSKVDATREAAARAGCVVLFKGPDTVIADPSGRCAINSAAYDRSAPWLATAGSGDVLAGFITGLLARGFAPMHAAETAAWLHVECARSFGPGLIAEDLPEELPKVFRALGL